MSTLKKLIPVFFFAGIFALVLWQIQPPQSLTSATIFQILLFFIPLFLLFTCIINIYFDFFIRSIIIGLGITILLIFKSLEMLNIVSVVLTISAIIFLVVSFKKPKRIQQSKIQSLKLRKQH